MCSEYGLGDVKQCLCRYIMQNYLTIVTQQGINETRLCSGLKDYYYKLWKLLKNDHTYMVGPSIIYRTIGTNVR